MIIKNKPMTVTGVFEYPPELRFTSYGKPVLAMKMLEGIHAEAWNDLAQQMSDHDALFETGRTVTLTGRTRVHTWKRDGQEYSRTVLTVESYTVHA
jgi:hypothetical protein